MLVFVSLSAGAAIDHAIYLAVIELDHGGGGPSAQATVKVFTDDMQDALRNAFGEEFRAVGEADFCVRLSGQAGAYFAEHFTCRINGRPAPLTLKNCTLEGDVYLLQFDMECPERWEKLEVEADFFMELFPTQSNVLSILHGEERGFFRLTKKDPVASIIF